MIRRKRAMIMIMVVILIAAITTVIAASVDLSRMAVLKQKQSERTAKWQYCVDSAKAIVVEDMVQLVGTNQNFTRTINGIDLTISAAPDPDWNNTTSTQISVSGVVDGKATSTQIYVGKRATVNPFNFGIVITNKFQLNSTMKLTGDAFVPTNEDVSSMSISGDIYSPLTSAPNLESQTGSFIGRQPTPVIPIGDDATYAANASVSTSGTVTLSNPIGNLFSPRSQLRYHSGNLTISGVVIGEITIYVTGSVTLSGISNKSSGLARLVVICNGDLQIESGVNNVFAMASGKISTSSTSGTRTIKGSLVASDFSGISKNFTITFDNYFASTSTAGYRYWIPGQW